MTKIRKSTGVIAITLGLVAVAGLYSYLFYFPWAGGYQVNTDERSGYEFAQANRLASTDSCPMYAEVPGFEVGCRSYF